MSATVKDTQARAFTREATARQREGIYRLAASAYVKAALLFEQLGNARDAAEVWEKVEECSRMRSQELFRQVRRSFDY